ncbi:transmembrane protein, putative [Rhizoctonia solani AG-3 Rhs1AP]|uniref:Transmembrane protein, putative n=1 Tax=Rhizoctonia solani AG-3 Rhs1AP TaxID=1086054 RepID=A0A0A1UIA8_9AGAM|nr:transmembrane protein, putative [Rhizoctonia solani AG-3 Rhs1AP]
MGDVEPETHVSNLPTNTTMHNPDGTEEIPERGRQTPNSGVGPNPSSPPTESHGPSDTVLGTQVPDENEGMFDEPGFELGTGARVWKTYVKEATKHDLELVGEWNRTLDVMLIFAALFSAIVTTLLNESSKGLHEDFSETSARTLLLMSQTLVAIANNRQIPDTPTEPPIIQPFRPRQMDVYVNALWFTSLGLSILVSFICILAKEWCFNFTSGSPDEPHPQARKRQIRWNGVAEWRLRQLMLVLPSIMHIALTLPVAVICIGIILFYLLATVFHLISDRCPYSTAASRIIESCFRAPKFTEDDYCEQDKITSQSIAWLIKTSRNHASVDTALQAIAGADNSLPRQPLLQCGAISLITTRLKVLGDDCAKDQTRAYIRGLYIRALRFLESPIPSKQSEQEQVDLESKLKNKIRYLRRMLESTIARHVALSDAANRTLSSGANVRALRAATRALAESLWVRDRGVDNPSDQLSALEDITNQLELYERDPSTLHPASGLAVVVGAATLYACIPSNKNSDAAVRYVLRALPEEARLPNRYLGMILAPFALSRPESSNQQRRNALAEINQVLTAVETIIFYLPVLSTLDDNTATSMIEFGLAHLLHNSIAYNLSAQDLERIHTAFTRLSNNDIVLIEGLPPGFSIRQYALDSVALPATQEEDREFKPSLSPPESIRGSHDVPRSVIGMGVVHHNERGEPVIPTSTSTGITEYCIVVTLADLFPKFLPDCDASTTAELADLLLANIQLCNQHLGLLLVVFVLSISHNVVESTQSSQSRSPLSITGSASCELLSSVAQST